MHATNSKLQQAMRSNESATAAAAVAVAVVATAVVAAKQASLRTAALCWKNHICQLRGELAQLNAAV